MDERYETEIIRDVLQGNMQRFEKLVREYQGPVFNLMFRTVNDDNVAADLAQETFFKAYSRLETFDTTKRFFPWLYSIGLNVARDHLRSRGRDFHVYMENPSVMYRDDGVRDEQTMVEERLDGGKMLEFIQQMAPKYREALLLRFKHGLSMKEIGEALDITVSGAKMRVSRGLDIVREEFGEVSDAS
ncbi:sigma-70 family RNA polymerase sigma factor [Pseudodesulfovibrio sp. zrk46]|uniref:RNA polymerase sigma factor n=1 Tax=Pseudodesulfovibrio sp. zrk46 TaxID=2725288 RepID=UPI00144A2051|nr:sigma-70 family RNA polymerase sigma factor [Pseudodesulfovibrio sp. zrk46]QJB57004.1 sigma-70 family RNA polymerase sigma factor [Pseudodesulfovibrio sp. zrk46]